MTVLLVVFLGGMLIAICLVALRLESRLNQLFTTFKRGETHMVDAIDAVTAAVAAETDEVQKVIAVLKQQADEIAQLAAQPTIDQQRLQAVAAAIQVNTAALAAALPQPAPAPSTTPPADPTPAPPAAA